MVKESGIKSIKKVSVSFYGLQKESGQLELFNISQQRKKSVISKVLDDLNKKLGINTVTLGIMPNKHKIKSAAAFGYIPDYKEK